MKVDNENLMILLHLKNEKRKKRLFFIKYL